MQYAQFFFFLFFCTPVTATLAPEGSHATYLRMILALTTRRRKLFRNMIINQQVIIELLKVEKGVTSTSEDLEEYRETNEEEKLLFLPPGIPSTF